MPSTGPHARSHREQSWASPSPSSARPVGATAGHGLTRTPERQPVPPERPCSTCQPGAATRGDPVCDHPSGLRRGSDRRDADHPCRARGPTPNPWVKEFAMTTSLSANRRHVDEVRPFHAPASLFEDLQTVLVRPAAHDHRCLGKRGMATQVGKRHSLSDTDSRPVSSTAAHGGPPDPADYTRRYVRWPM